MFCKIDALKNVAKFRGKQLCRGLLFNEVAGLRPYIEKCASEKTPVLACFISVDY